MIGYTRAMDGVVLLVLAVVVAAVAIDAIARLDERPKKQLREKDPTITTTQKIRVDLSRRR